MRTIHLVILISIHLFKSMQLSYRHHPSFVNQTILLIIPKVHFLSHQFFTLISIYKLLTALSLIQAAFKLFLHFEDL